MLFISALCSSNIFSRSADVATFSSGRLDASASNSSTVNIIIAKPGSWARCDASSPSDLDFGWGRQSLLPSGTRASMRRVVASSPSRSGKSAAAGAGLELDAVAVADRVRVVVFFLGVDRFLLADLV